MTNRSTSAQLAGLELFFAAWLWGFGFVAMRWTADWISPLGLNFHRFFWIALIGGVLALFFKRPRLMDATDLLAKTVVPGASLGLGLLCQTIGTQKTSLANAGFLTVLYVVGVPVLDWLVFSTKISKLTFACVIAAIGGSLLMAWPAAESIGGQSGSTLFFFSNLNIGDLWILAAAVCFSVQILAVDRMAGAALFTPFALNLGQAFWAAVVSGLTAMWVNPMGLAPHGELTPHALMGILSLSLGSSLIGFWIQIRAQRHISATAASLIFLIEGPVAAYFGYLFFQERLEGLSAWGAGIVMTAAILQISTARRK